MAFNLTPTQINPVDFDVSDAFMRGFSLVNTLKQQQFENELALANQALAERGTAAQERQVDLQAARDEQARIDAAFGREQQLAEFDQSVIEADKNRQAIIDAETREWQRKNEEDPFAMYKNPFSGSEERMRRSTYIDLMNASAAGDTNSIQRAMLKMQLEQLEQQQEAEKFQNEVADFVSRYVATSARDVNPVPNKVRTAAEMEDLYTNMQFVSQFSDQYERFEARARELGPMATPAMQMLSGAYDIATTRMQGLRNVENRTRPQQPIVSFGHYAGAPSPMLRAQNDQGGFSVQTPGGRVTVNHATLKEQIDALEGRMLTRVATGTVRQQLLSPQSDYDTARGQIMQAGSQIIAEGDADPDILTRAYTDIVARETSGRQGN